MGGRGAKSGIGGKLKSAIDKNYRDVSNKFYPAFKFFSDAYGETHADKIMKRLIKAPEDVREVFAMYASQFAAGPEGVAHDQHNFYRPSEMQAYVDIDYVSKSSKYFTAYETVFHEYGHMIDDVAFRGNGISRGSFYGYGSERTYKLGEIATTELMAKINDIQEKKFPGTAGNLDFTKQARDILLRDIAKQYPSYKSKVDISDMIEGALTKSGIGVKRPFGTGHSMNYWSDHSLSAEIFAEITSAMISNNKSLTAIKNLFPKTYDKYTQMLYDIIHPYDPWK